MVVVLVLLTIVIAVSFQALRERAAGNPALEPVAPPVPLNGSLFVHGGHTWAQLDTSGEAKVGIDHFLAKVLGGADAVSLPVPGRAVRQGERVFSIRRGDHEFRLVSPIEGVVASVNEKADLNDGAVLRDPYRKGWLFSIRPRNLAESLRHVRDRDEAGDWFESEARRFSSFLLTTQPPLAEVGATMPDGGQYPPGIVEKMSEEQVQAFKCRFLA